MAPIAVLNATDTQYVVDVPAEHERSSYYSITYLLPNYTEAGEDYEDFRFVGQNTLSEPVAEDNRPPAQPMLLHGRIHPQSVGRNGLHQPQLGRCIAEETGAITRAKSGLSKQMPTRHHAITKRRGIARVGHS